MSIDPVNDNFQTFRSNRIKKFKSIINSDQNVLDILYPKLNSTVQNLERERKAALLSLVSESYKSNQRSGIHVLFHGDPGTAKTDILRFIAKDMAKDGNHWEDDNWNMAGSDTSGVGLKYNANTDEPGLLNQSHKGVIAIDEIDKMSKDERKALLEAMEEGEYDVNKGGVKKTFNAKVRVLASANRIDDFRKELLDRFDLVINLKHPKREGAKEIVHHIVDTFFDDVDDEADFLREFIAWIRGINPPKVTDEYNQKVKEMYNAIIDYNYDEEDRVGLRGKISPYRIALGIGKINGDTVLKPKRFVEALDIYNDGLEEELREDLEDII